MAIKLLPFKEFEHPSYWMPVYSKPSVTVFAYHRLRWEYTWRNEEFISQAIDIYKSFVSLFRSGFIDKDADFSTVICDNRYRRFKSIPQLQPFSDNWKWMCDRKATSEYEDHRNSTIAIKDYLTRKYATLLPKDFHKSIARIRKSTNTLLRKYGYRGILLDYETTPWPIDIIIRLSFDNAFPYTDERNRREPGYTIDSKAIKVYDQKKYPTNRYEYDGDVLLSIDFTKTDETILNDIQLLIRNIRRENHLEPIYMDSEEREIRDKTKTKLNMKDYKSRLLGLWLVDYKELYECGGYRAIEALRDTGYIGKLGINDNERAWLRLIAATERCIEVAGVLPITSKP